MPAMGVSVASPTSSPGKRLAKLCLMVALIASCEARSAAAVSTAGVTDSAGDAVLSSEAASGDAAAWSCTAVPSAVPASFFAVAPALSDGLAIDCDTGVSVGVFAQDTEAISPKLATKAKAVLEIARLAGREAGME